jgi:hypothetical protein
MSATTGFRKSKELLFDLAKASGEQVLCPQCGDPMEPAGNTKRSATRDHILPRTRRYTYPPDTIMHKIMCAHCNALRGMCGHCWGAVACVRAVAKPKSAMSEIGIASKWGLHSLQVKAEPPPKFIPAGEPAKYGPPRTGFATLADVWPRS